MKNAHLHFLDGNVIRAPGGDLWIVTDVSDDVISAVSFDSENCSAVQKLDDHERKETCLCGDHPDFMGEPQEDCKDCHGAGHFTKKITGWRHSKVVARTVKDFIMNGVKKQFDL